MERLKGLNWSTVDRLSKGEIREVQDELAAQAALCDVENGLDLLATGILYKYGFLTKTAVMRLLEEKASTVAKRVGSIYSAEEIESFKSTDKKLARLIFHNPEKLTDFHIEYLDILERAKAYLMFDGYMADIEDFRRKYL